LHRQPILADSTDRRATRVFLHGSFDVRQSLCSKTLVELNGGGEVGESFRESRLVESCPGFEFVLDFGETATRFRRPRSVTDASRGRTGDSPRVYGSGGFLSPSE
jgi:hypothetical protein